MSKKSALSKMVVGFLILGIVAELVARYCLRLGDSPLVITHPKIEYMFAPDQNVRPFGNIFKTNRYGMRGEEIPVTKAQGEIRVIVIGDSVVNGGNLTDQANLATTMLTHGRMRFLNISAGSWGPQNMRAYIDTFGTFDADYLVLVLSSHDIDDVPTFAPLDPETHPTRRPLSAAWEGLTRYLPRYLHHGPSSIRTPLPTPRLEALNAETGILKVLPSCLLIHSRRDELRRSPAAFAYLIQAAAGHPIVMDAPFMRADTSYRDNIHPSDAGQKALAAAISGCIEKIAKRQ